MNLSQAKDSPLCLRGMTWAHTRGYLPMVATAQRYSELHPGIEIVWEKRSLQEFADQPLDRLAEAYDLLVIDHPWAGFAAAQGILRRLDDLLPADFLQQQAAHAVGQSHASYRYGESQWALAIDAAAPVAAWRPDLLEKAGAEVPRTWEEVIALARRGLVACPSIPLDTYGNFLNLCVTAGAAIFPDEETVVAEEAGVQALERLRELAALVPRRFFELNPIRTLEVMSREEGFAYCPYTYGYANYARDGYARHPLWFGEPPAVGGRPASTMLGGTGLAISARCGEPAAAAAYAAFVAAPETQAALYFDSGGQPGHRQAWLDGRINRESRDFFRRTLPALDRAFVRPRHEHYLQFQDRAGDVVHRFLRGEGRARAAMALAELTALYRQTAPALR
jgi:multiple sugar transport system substrate-binding protein